METFELFTLAFMQRAILGALLLSTAAMMAMSEKLSETIQEMQQETSLEQIRIEACKQICLDTANLMVVLCSDMGTKEQAITYTKLSELSNVKSGRLHSLVIPANLSDVENSALHRWAKE